jgi:ribosomal protein S18 acetylase RimI-like enzyme
MAAAVPVRPLLVADLEPLRWVIYRAYLQVLVELYGSEAAAGYEVRSLDFMKLYLRRDPAGCFVAEAPGGDPAGAIFCFVWGEVGWFGSLAVAPEWQGHGLGQALTRKALDYLAGRGCRRLGLETWPHSPLVRHLYGKFGFRPVRSTVKFSRPIPMPDGPDPLPGGLAGAGVAGAGVAGDGGAAGGEVTWLASGGGTGAEGAQDLLDAVDAVTRAQGDAVPGEPRVDYRLEVEVPVAAGWADLAVVRDESGAPAGYVLCCLRRPGGGPVAALDVRLLGVAPRGDPAPVLDRLLTACDERAREAGVPSVTVDLNLRHATAASLLRERRFRPVYELLRMERPVPGFDPLARSPVIDCARWAG